MFKVGDLITGIDRSYARSIYRFEGITSTLNNYFQGEKVASLQFVLLKFDPSKEPCLGRKGDIRFQPIEALPVYGFKDIMSEFRSASGEELAAVGIDPETKETPWI